MRKYYSIRVQHSDVALATRLPELPFLFVRNEKYYELECILQVYLPASFHECQFGANSYSHVFVDIFENFCDECPYIVWLACGFGRRLTDRILKALSVLNGMSAFRPGGLALSMWKIYQW